MSRDEVRMPLEHMLEHAREAAILVRGKTRRCRAPGFSEEPGGERIGSWVLTLWPG